MVNVIHLHMYGENNNREERYKQALKELKEFFFDKAEPMERINKDIGIRIKWA